MIFSVIGETGNIQRENDVTLQNADKQSKTLIFRAFVTEFSLLYTCVCILFKMTIFQKIIPKLIL